MPVHIELGQLLQILETVYKVGFYSGKTWDEDKVDAAWNTDINDVLNHIDENFGVTIQ